MSRIKKRLSITLVFILTALVLPALIVACAPQQGTNLPSGGSEAHEGAFVSDEQCMSCHGGSYESVAELTADLGLWNPHSSIHGGYNSCVNCHEEDRVISNNYCNTCHVYEPEAEPLFLL